MKVKRRSYHLSYYHIIIYIISHLWSGIDSELLAGYSINAPRNVMVQRGLCVYIPCNFTVPETETLTRNAEGIWYKENFKIVASKRNTTMGDNNGRFFLVGDVWRGDCSLYIEDPLYEDEGAYRFRVEDEVEFKFSYRDVIPNVKVTDLTNKPEISPIKSWLDGEEVTLRCTSPGTCLGITPKITWRGNIQNGRVENNVDTHENGTKTHFSTITFTARKEQNNSTLSCIVQLNGGLTTVQEITMKVESSMDYKVIFGLISGSLIILILVVLGVFWCVKRHMKKKQENNDMQLSNARGTESVYQDLQKPTNSTYETIIRSQQ